jgi:uncharacterized protein with beta-barrel porin domain
MNKTTISGIMLAVAVLATGCNKADNNSMGPAQEAGKAVDQAGANVARETREGIERADQATERAAANAERTAERAGDNIERAGAEVRQESREAAQDVKQGVSNATEATGRSVERAGERMQDAAK